MRTPKPKVRAATAKKAKPAAPPPKPVGLIHEVSRALVADLKDHPRNYRQHPDDQLDHLIASIKEHGFYRNIVVAKDGYILAGHGIVKAVRKMGIAEVPVIRLNVGHDDPRALKVMTGDNETGNLAETDDRALSELLKEISSSPVGLVGTGYDISQLMALAMVSRPASEIGDLNEAAEWLGMPEYQATGEDQYKLIITFRNTEDRERFKTQAKLTIDKIAGASWSTRWPFSEREDGASLKFEVAQ